MPEDDVSDLRDVVDAINKLCDTMKTSTYDEIECTEELDSLAGSQYDCNETNEIYTLSDDFPVNEARSDTITGVYTSSEDCPVNSVRLDTITEAYTSPEDCQVNEVRSDTVTSQYSEEADIDVQCVEYRDIELVSPEEVLVQKAEMYNTERWSDATSQMSLPGQIEDVETVTSDTEPVLAQCETVSEMYYTASSEVSLLSDLDVPITEKVQECEKETRDDRKECVIAGHVAAMRERFESMTRTNTPCPDMVRSISPSLEVFRTTSPSPDRLA